MCCVHSCFVSGVLSVFLSSVRSFCLSFFLSHNLRSNLRALWPTLVKARLMVPRNVQLLACICSINTHYKKQSKQFNTHYKKQTHFIPSPPVSWLQRIVRILPQCHKISSPKRRIIPLLNNDSQLALEAGVHAFNQIKPTQKSPPLTPLFSCEKPTRPEFVPEALQCHGRTRRPTLMLTTL